MGRPIKCRFTPKNPAKYLGHNITNIITRSSLENSACLLFDNHPSILGWMSESLPSHTVHKGLDGIPYINPFTGRPSIYVPDFFVIYEDRNGGKHTEVIEIKPTEEILGFRGKVSKLKEARQILNAAKFVAAVKFCSARGWLFRIATETEIFAWTRKTANA